MSTKNERDAEFAPDLLAAFQKNGIGKAKEKASETSSGTSSSENSQAENSEASKLYKKQVSASTGSGPTSKANSKEPVSPNGPQTGHHGGSPEAEPFVAASGSPKASSSASKAAGKAKSSSPVAAQSGKSKSLPPKGANSAKSPPPAPQAAQKGKRPSSAGPATGGPVAAQQQSPAKSSFQSAKSTKSSQKAAPKAITPSAGSKSATNATVQTPSPTESSFYSAQSTPSGSKAAPKAKTLSPGSKSGSHSSPKAGPQRGSKAHISSGPRTPSPKGKRKSKVISPGGYWADRTAGSEEAEVPGSFGYETTAKDSSTEGATDGEAETAPAKGAAASQSLAPSNAKVQGASGNAAAATQSHSTPKLPSPGSYKDNPLHLYDGEDEVTDKYIHPGPRPKVTVKVLDYGPNSNPATQFSDRELVLPTRSALPRVPASMLANAYRVILKQSNPPAYDGTQDGSWGWMQGAIVATSCGFHPISYDKGDEDGDVDRPLLGLTIGKKNDFWLLTADLGHLLDIDTWVNPDSADGAKYTQAEMEVWYIFPLALPNRAVQVPYYHFWAPRLRIAPEEAPPPKEASPKPKKAAKVVPVKRAVVNQARFEREAQEQLNFAGLERTLNEYANYFPIAAAWLSRPFRARQRRSAARKTAEFRGLPDSHADRSVASKLARLCMDKTDFGHPDSFVRWPVFFGDAGTDPEGDEGSNANGDEDSDPKGDESSDSKGDEDSDLKDKYAYLFDPDPEDENQHEQESEEDQHEQEPEDDQNEQEPEQTQTEQEPEQNQDAAAQQKTKTKTATEAAANEPVTPTRKRKRASLPTTTEAAANEPVTPSNKRKRASPPTEPSDSSLTSVPTDFSINERPSDFSINEQPSSKRPRSESYIADSVEELAPGQLPAHSAPSPPAKKPKPKAKPKAKPKQAAKPQETLANKHGVKKSGPKKAPAKGAAVKKALLKQAAAEELSDQDILVTDSNSTPTSQPPRGPTKKVATTKGGPKKVTAKAKTVSDAGAYKPADDEASLEEPSVTTAPRKRGRPKKAAPKKAAPKKAAPKKAAPKKAAAPKTPPKDPLPVRSPQHDPRTRRQHVLQARGLNRTPSVERPKKKGGRQ